MPNLHDLNIKAVVCCSGGIFCQNLEATDKSKMKDENQLSPVKFGADLPD
jgi:hypothetical protein